MTFIYDSKIFMTLKFQEINKAIKANNPHEAKTYF